MKHDAVLAGSREFIRGYRKFKEFAIRGGRVTIRDRDGNEFVFLKTVEKQHPPRRASQPLDPRRFAGIDLDAPAVVPNEWEANR